MKTLIMGIGNILRGDDGIGSAVIAHLETLPLPPNVDLLDAGTAGFDMVLLMQGYDAVIVVDAAEMGLVAGEWRAFTAQEIKQGAGNLYLRGTLHYAGLAEALNLGEALGVLPPQIGIIGVQPQHIDWQEGLSPAIEAVVEQVSAAVLAHHHQLQKITG